MRAVILALALALGAGQAQAGVQVLRSGVAVSGELVTLQLPSTGWFDPQDGTLTIEGGTFSDAFLLVTGERVFRGGIVVPFEFNCDASDLPCDGPPQFTAFGTDSLSILVPRIRGHEIPGAPSAVWRKGDSRNRNFTTLTFRAVGDGPISYEYRGYITAPEPETWALMIGGFGLAGVSLRRRRAPAH